MLSLHPNCHIIPISPKQADHFWNLTSDNRPKKPSYLRLTIHINQETSVGRNKENWTNRAIPQQSQSARSAADRTLSTDTRSEGVVWGWGRGRGAVRDLPCRRAPFLLKKVLPGQRGGPDVLKQNRNQREGELVYTHSVALRKQPFLQTHPSKWPQNTFPIMHYLHPLKMFL